MSNELLHERLLVERSCRGDTAAFADIIRHYQSQVRACLHVRLREHGIAEDLAQDTFIVAFNKISKFDKTKPLGPWLKGIAINLLKNYQRKHRPIPIGGSDELARLLDAEIQTHYTDNEQESELLAALEQCLKKLDAHLKVLLKQHYTEGLSVAELTKLYDVKHSTITMRLFRVRERLRHCITASLEINR